MPTRMTTRVPLVAIATILTAAGPGRAQCRYEVTVIQAPPCPVTGHPGTQGFDINDAGELVGRYAQCGVSENEAFVWSHTGGFETLDRPPELQGAWANALNDCGDVVGHVRFGNRPHAVLWRDGLIEALPEVAGSNRSSAEAVNASGEIAGSSGNTSVAGVNYAVAWNNGRMRYLAPDDLPFGPKSTALDINDAGDVVGWMGTGVFEARAFLWNDNGVIDLGLLPGAFAATATGINNHTQIVGSCRLPNPRIPSGEQHAFLWSADLMKELERLADFVAAAADDINDLGRVVGSSWITSAADQRAVVWHNGRLHDLNELINARDVYLRQAHAINNAGQICVTGSFGIDAATFLLTPKNRPPADVDGDCEVGVTDLVRIILAWGTDDAFADLNADGVVDRDDLILVITAWS